MKNVIYEPHPVSPERKAELRAKGLQIIDAAFKPAEEAKKAEKAEKKTPAELVDQQFAGLTDEQIHEWCKERDLGPIHHKLKGDKLKARVAELIA